jgi:hypothetical protein
MENKEPIKWLGRHIIQDPTDIDRLDAASSVHEFRGGLPKEQAEDRAYGDYLDDKARDACAFHYLGMRASVAAQHEPATKRHGEAYSLAMKHLGLNPLDAPPKEILDRVKDASKGPYSFKPHSADSFFQPKVEIPGVKEEPANRTLELLEKLKALKVKPQS